MNKINYAGEEFLNRLYKDLHLSDEVMHTAQPSDNKNEKVRKYLDRLESAEELARNSKYNGIELLKRLYYKKYVIKEENIPESYFELQKKIAFERGYGKVYINEEMKEEMISSVIEDQKKSLDVWLDYFFSEDCPYPEWFRYYAFQGMLKLGSYDKEKNTFNKRTDKTTNIFADLNREALSLLYDNLVSVLEGQKIDDEILKKLLDGGNFSKLYSYAIKKVDEAKKDINGNDGVWIKYNQNSDPNVLVKTLEGKGTGWCTAGLETAKIQLEMGDFYIYYTKDSNGEFKQPRIAIRMEYGSIAEIRGIAYQQNIEPEMENVVEEKLKEFPDRDEYMKKVSDMKKLTFMYNETEKGNFNLSIEDLKFLYEINYKIDGFGYEKDPRISEIKEKRNTIEDLNKIFETLDCYEGDLDLDKVKKADTFILPKKMIGNIHLGHLKTIKKLILPEELTGEIYLPDLVSVDEISLPKFVDGDIILESLEEKENLICPEEITGSLKLNKLSTTKGLVLPKKVGKYLYLDGITAMKELILPEEIGTGLSMNSLVDDANLKLPNIIGKDLSLRSLKAIKNLVLPKELTFLDLSSLETVENFKIPEGVKVLRLNNLKSAKGLELPKKIYTLGLNNLKEIEGLILPEEVFELGLRGLETVDGLVLPKVVEGSLHLNSLKSAKNLQFPEEIGESLELNSLELAENLILPKIVHKSLNLGALTSINGIVLPDEVGGSLSLDKLEHLENVKLPNKVGGQLIMSNLISASNVIFPSEVEIIFLNNLKKAENVELPKKINKVMWLQSLESTEGLIIPKNFEYGRVGSAYISMEDLKNKSLEENNKTKQLGFSMVWLIGILTGIISIGIIIIGTYLIN